LVFLDKSDLSLHIFKLSSSCIYIQYFIARTLTRASEVLDLIYVLNVGYSAALCAIYWKYETGYNF